MLFRRTLLKSLIPLLVLALFVAACGTGNGGSTNTGGSGAAAAPTTPAASSAAVVKTASATVDGKTVTILTDTQGMTLYYRTSDTATSVCSGACAQAWPPLLFSGSGTPGSAATLPGTLSVMNDTNGAQVAYQGHLLYTYAKDTASGQTTGQNVGNVWFVATTDLTASGGSSGGGATPTPTTPSYGGYGY